MTLRIKSLLLCIGVLYSLNATASMTPQTKTYKLEENTSIEVDIMPDLAVQFVFPFILNSPKHKPPFIHRLTNENIFSIGNVEKEIDGQNTITVSIKKPKAGGVVFRNHTYLGNLFINVDGYRITILLRTTVNLKKHYTNIVFEPSQEKRRFLIEKEVEHIRKAEAEAYQKKLDQLNEMARQQAVAQVGWIALEDLDTVRIKYDQIVSIDNNQEVTVFVDKLLDYKKYIMLKFFVENTSNTNLTVNSVDWHARLDDGNDVEIASSLLCDGLIRAGADKACVLTTQNRRIIDAEQTRLSIMTNHGPFTVAW